MEGIAFAFMANQKLTSVTSSRLLFQGVLNAISLLVVSVVYWHFFEFSGQGDLRLYILIQFLPILIIPVVLIFFTSELSAKNAYWLL